MNSGTRLFKLIISAIGIGCASLAMSDRAQALAIVDSVNADKPTAKYAWLATEVGWLYTPNFSYSLSGILTKFEASGPAFNAGTVRTVTVEVYDKAPQAGGTLLRSANFTALFGAFSGGNFAPLSLIGGEDYFIGFRNVRDLGVNTTDAAGAIGLAPLYYSFANDGSYTKTESQYFTSNPILQFETEATSIPTPALLPGLIGFGVATWRKRKTEAASEV